MNKDLAVIIGFLLGALIRIVFASAVLYELHTISYRLTTQYKIEESNKLLNGLSK